MNGGWVRCEAGWWEATAAALQATGQPWPEEAVIMDLRWFWLRELAGGPRMPGRIELARRWNWKPSSRLRRVLTEKRWKYEVPRPDLSSWGDR
jgi:hypothetical protein